MTVLVVIACSTSQIEPAQTAIEIFCKETGGLLIGRRVNDETHKVLLMIRLPQTASANKHRTVLSEALQHHVIESFRYVSCDLVQISFNPSVNLQEQMRDFPLRPEESWFPAIHDSHEVYVSLSMPVMLAKQAAWLHAHEAEWAFV